MQIGGTPDETNTSFPPNQASFEEKEIPAKETESGPATRSSHKPPPSEAAHLENETLSSDKDNGLRIINAPPVEPLMPPIPLDGPPDKLELNATFDIEIDETVSKEAHPPPRVDIERTDKEFDNFTLLDCSIDTSPPLLATFPAKMHTKGSCSFGEGSVNEKTSG